MPLASCSDAIALLASFVEVVSTSCWMWSKNSASDTAGPLCRHVEYGRMDFNVDAVEMHQDAATISATFQVLLGWPVITIT